MSRKGMDLNTYDHLLDDEDLPDATRQAVARRRALLAEREVRVADFQKLTEELKEANAGGLIAYSYPLHRLKRRHQEAQAVLASTKPEIRRLNRELSLLEQQSKREDQEGLHERIDTAVRELTAAKSQFLSIVGELRNQLNGYRRDNQRLLERIEALEGEKSDG